MTRLWRLLVTWNKVVKTVSRAGSIDLPEPRLRLSVSGCTFGQAASARRSKIGQSEANEDEATKKTVIFQAEPLANLSGRRGKG